MLKVFDVVGETFHHINQTMVQVMLILERYILIAELGVKSTDQTREILNKNKITEEELKSFVKPKYLKAFGIFFFFFKFLVPCNTERGRHTRVV